MKYFRPQIEVEAMKFFDEDVFLVEFPDGTQLKMDSVDFARDFRKMNGQDPVKLRKKPERKKVNYQSSAQAPDLSTNEKTQLCVDSQIVEPAPVIKGGYRPHGQEEFPGAVADSVVSVRPA